MFATGKLKYRLFGKENKCHELWYHLHPSGNQQIHVS
jgi:hypothetical protein